MRENGGEGLGESLLWSSAVFIMVVHGQGWQKCVEIKLIYDANIVEDPLFISHEDPRFDS